MNGLRLSGATKLYRGIPAIEDVDFSLEPGEVHAVVGENGAGKSTLCKIMSGVVPLDAGQFVLDGEPAGLRSPRDALRAGIAMVYQETSLVPTMTVAQNIELGHEALFTRYRSLNTATQQLLQSMSFRVEPTAYVSTLGTAKKQLVEIARAIRTRARFIIFDEPTASLSPEEILHLFEVITSLTQAGVGVVFVSHALEESLRIADRISVLRDGRLQVCDRAEAFTRERLVRHMVGREIARTAYRERRGVTATATADTADTADTAAERPKPRKVLSVENVTMGNVVKNMSFSAYAGEVLGIAGLIGSGRTEVAKIVAGALKRNRVQGGMVYLNGVPLRNRVTRQAVNHRVAYVTEDRKLDGFFETMTVADNIYLGRLATRTGRRVVVSGRERRSLAAQWIERLRIRAGSPDAKLVELSGGNQQKVTMAKSLVQDPELIILDEPTRGVDVGSIEEIHQIIRKLADEGRAVIVISSYLPEILAVSDRILVARQGRIVDELLPEEATEEKILYAAIH